jgi:sarcosine oxidase subunit gamma
MESDCVADDRITLAEVEWALAWNVRGNEAQTAFVSEAARLLGVALPLEPNTTTRRNGATVLWLGPRSWLVVLQLDAIGDDFDATRAAFNAAGGALFDLSSSYVGWRVSGPGTARMLNRSCPLDLDLPAFAAGACAQSMLGHVNALYYRPREAAEFIVIVARSFAVDAWENLCAAAATDGYRVGPRAGL